MQKVHLWKQTLFWQPNRKFVAIVGMPSSCVWFPGNAITNKMYILNTVSDTLDKSICQLKYKYNFLMPFRVQKSLKNSFNISIHWLQCMSRLPINPIKFIIFLLQISCNLKPKHIRSSEDMLVTSKLTGSQIFLWSTVCTVSWLKSHLWCNR